MSSYLYAKGSMVIEELIDPIKMKAQLTQTLNELVAEIQRAKQMLSNPRFLEKAPTQKIKEEKDKLALYQRQYDETKAKLETLKF